jgi:hypothetical protein
MGYNFMSRFFIVTHVLYESVRSEMDAFSGYPSNEATTWFSPASDAVSDNNGNIFIAAIEPIAEKFLTSGAREINREEFFFLIEALSDGEKL